MSTILSKVPISIRMPGVFNELEFVDNVQGLVPTPRRVVVVAEAKGGTAPVEVPVQLFSEADADAKLGAQTFAALMARMAFKAGQLVGATPEVWACPIAEPGGGVAAAQTGTVTGTATEAGTMILRIAGRQLFVGVNKGDGQNTVAAAIKSASDAIKLTLPVSAAVGANVVTWTNTTKGVNGNDVAFELLQGVAGIALALAQSVAGAGAASITNALNALYDKRYHALATSNHTTTDIATELLDLALAWGFAAFNTRYYFMGERGSLGTAQSLQAAADDFPIHIISCEQIPRLPGEMAIAAATAWMAFDDPNVNMDGVLLPLEPPTGAFAYTTTEIESALAGGVTPLRPAGPFVSIVRLVTSQISVSLADPTPIESLRESAISRTSALLAEQVAIRVAQGLRQAVETDALLDDARDIIIEVDRTFERLGYIKAVDTYLDKIKTEYADAPGGRMSATNPHKVVPPLHQVVVRTTSFQ